MKPGKAIFSTFAPLLVSGVDGLAQETKAAPNSPEAVAAAIWQKVTSTCAVPGVSKPVVFFDKVSPIYGKKNSWLLELRDAWTAYKASDLPDADKLNGIQHKGYTVLGYSAERSIRLDLGQRTPETGWGEFSSGPLITRQEFLNPKPNVYYSGVGLYSVFIEERNGKWSFKPGWDDHALDPDLYASNKRSCAALTSADPLAAR